MVKKKQKKMCLSNSAKLTSSFVLQKPWFYPTSKGNAKCVTQNFDRIQKIVQDNSTFFEQSLL